jgi:UDPglucose--hexose-1-phosphate uridylyltransferase
MIEVVLGNLLAYGVDTGLIEVGDVPYVRNRVLEVLRISDYDLTVEGTGADGTIDDLLAPLLDDAAARGLIEPDTATQRDLWDTAIMGCFVQRPSWVQHRFWDDYRTSARLATDRFHGDAVASNYIRVTRTDRNVTWEQPSKYGVLDMTINLSKPEKDPRDIIAAARTSAEAAYPACLLCRENEGYAGRADHPARQNLRLVDLELTGERWFLQYSPYRYYNEHCIVLSEEHRPMVITPVTFRRLAEFTAVLPHYLAGSNADLPIVGGSILSHDHYQGGNYEFPMDRAQTLWSEDRDGVTVSVLNWPLAVIRLVGDDEAVLALADRVLAAWREYSDAARGVLAYSGQTPHNTITPIARRVDGVLRLDLVLRNNRTSDEHPDGIYHPHVEIHPIKKENIGLIEVMGLAVLPDRLQVELQMVADALMSGGSLPESAAAHAPMLASLRADGRATSAENALHRAREAAGDYFVRGLEQCGVFGDDVVAGCAEFLAVV